MTRGHRRTHAMVWLVLAPMIVALLIVALAARRSAPVQDPPAVGGLP